MPQSLPTHLRRYIVDQDYSRYTSIDQEVWRYIMRQLKGHLATHAHASYLDGLEKSGITIDRIPDISAMSERLEPYGWRAVPVSGFIPPAAFMELQALGFLPIASDLRSIDHLLYTPAPDIVHEAAGHAPLLVDPAFASYLKAYAQVARKAIVSREDLDQYEAIRVLSDLKEDPDSQPAQIQAAEAHLERVTESISHLSEAAILGRMNWWTAEYGLIGSLENPKIYGAGLLSSIGESRSCLDPKVTKLRFGIDCIDYAYDITEPQPQLFVTPDFQTLGDVLEQLAERMAFRLGGLEGLKRAQLADTVNTVELSSGLQISGRLKNVVALDNIEPAYLQFEGPTQLALRETQISGHGVSTHPHGFGSPVGLLESAAGCLSDMSDSDLHRLGIAHGRKVHLKFTSGVEVHGEVTSTLREPDGRLVLISFKDCRVVHHDRVLFDPSWGTYDMAVGTKVVSVFGGPADRAAFGTTDDFVTKVIPRRLFTPLEQHKQRLYGDVRRIREHFKGASSGPADAASATALETIADVLDADFPHDWLLRLSLLELAGQLAPTHESLTARLELTLANLGAADSTIQERIADGRRAFGVS